jgi:hypothetical protein
MGLSCENSLPGIAERLLGPQFSFLMVPSRARIALL